MDDIDRNSLVPVYVQLAAILRDRIESGAIGRGQVLPSKRQLRGEFGVSGETCDKAIGLLRAEGRLVTVRGKGHYVKP